MKRFHFAFILLLAPLLHAAKKPNFVYIMLDDAGYGDFSCFGQEKFQTPNIDRMAKEGMRMTQFYSGSTVCAPARCSLMTGLHTGHCQVRGNREIQPEGQAPLEDGTITLPLILSKGGYKTGMFGKWGLGAPGSVSDPANHFDTFYGYNCQRQAHTYYPGHLWSNKKKVPLDGHTYAHTLIADQALKFIRKNRKKPFFAYIPITIPHAAMQAPESYVAPFRKEFPEFKDVIGKYSHGTKVKNPIAAFAGMMTLADEDIGKILDLLKELKIDENTFVLLTSDNGPHYEGGHKPQFFNSNGPLKGHKRDLFEGGIRVPTIAWWPGTVKAGTDNEHISAFWDMLPTYCDLAGIDAPKNDGISFAPSLRGSEQPEHPYLYWEFHSHGGKQAIRKGKWKAIRNNVKKATKTPTELFNLEEDIGETKNIANQHPKVVKELEQLMDEAHEPHPNYLFASDKN
jgi:arylsulfatase A